MSAPLAADPHPNRLAPFLNREARLLCLRPLGRATASGLHSLPLDRHACHSSTERPASSASALSAATASELHPSQAHQLHGTHSQQVSCAVFSRAVLFWVVRSMKDERRHCSCGLRLKHDGAGLAILCSTVAAPHCLGGPTLLVRRRSGQLCATSQLRQTRHPLLGLRRTRMPGTGRLRVLVVRSSSPPRESLSTMHTRLACAVLMRIVLNAQSLYFLATVTGERNAVRKSSSFLR